MKTILNYASQESTWRGIIQMATFAGVAIKPELAALIISTGMGLVGLINFFKNSNPTKK